jgi:hypothetical protein
MKMLEETSRQLEMSADEASEFFKHQGPPLIESGEVKIGRLSIDSDAAKAMKFGAENRELFSALDPDGKMRMQLLTQ